MLDYAFMLEKAGMIEGYFRFKIVASLRIRIGCWLMAYGLFLLSSMIDKRKKQKKRPWKSLLTVDKKQIDDAVWLYNGV